MDVEHYVFPATETTTDSLDNLKKEIEKGSSTDSVLTFKMEVKGNLNENDTEKVKFLSKIIESKSILVSFQSTFDNKCIIYWKTKESKEFLILKLIHGHQLQNCNDMVRDFLILQLKMGHFGLLPKYRGCGGKEITLSIIADANGFNLLMDASEKGNVDVVKYLLKQHVDVSHKANDKCAVDLAWERKHFNVVLELLKANSKFPTDKSFREGLPTAIQNFVDVCDGMHRAINDKDEEKIRNIANDNPRLRHFFNVDSNSSAMDHTLRKGKGHVEIYELLFRLNIYWGPNESAFFHKMPRQTVQDIHNDCSVVSPQSHLFTLISNSRLFIDNIENHFQSIKEAYEILDSIPCIKPILQVVAASQNFNIFFDFNRDTVKLMDPLTVQSANGMFYPEGKLYLAFKEFLHADTKFKAIGVLAHELCHFAMHLVFRNDRKPYAVDDRETEIEFERITKLYNDRNHDEEIIRLVYVYKVDKHHTELIVRVPHIMAHYHRNRDRFGECLNEFDELFTFFNTKTLPAIEKAIPVIEMISSENISYDLLTPELQSKVLLSEVECDRKAVTLMNAQRFDECILQKLTSSQICDILNSKVIKVETDIYVGRQFIDRNIDSPYMKSFINDSDVIDFIHLDKFRSFRDLVTESQISRGIILSDGPGAGKTTSFKQFKFKIKAMYPNFWVFYIDLKQQIDIYKEYQSKKEEEEEIGNTIVKILNFTSDNERLTFLKDFKDSNNSLFLWDGFDEIAESLDYKMFTLNLIRKIKLLGHQQWISTRPQYASEFEMEFSTTAYKLIPFTAENRKENLEMFFELKGLHSEEVSEKIHSIGMFLEKLDSTLITQAFNNPLLLSIAAENSLHENLEDCNVYSMYEKFIFEKVKKLRDKGDVIQNIRDQAIVDGVNITKVHQKSALDSLFSVSSDKYLGRTIRISQLKVLGQDDKMSKNKSSVYGISFVKHDKLKTNSDKLEFVHPTFAEFFVAQFLIKSCFNVNREENDEFDSDWDLNEFDATQIIFLLFSIISKDVIFNFIFDYVNQYSANISVKVSIRQTLKSLVNNEQNIFKNNFSDFQSIMHNLTKLFSFDHEILRYAWTLDLNENLFIFTLKDKIDSFIYTIDLMFGFVYRNFKNVQRKIVYKYCCDHVDSSSFSHIFSTCNRTTNIRHSGQKTIRIRGSLTELNLLWIETENEIKIYFKFEMDILIEIISILRQIPNITDDILAGKHQSGCNLFKFWHHIHHIHHIHGSRHKLVRKLTEFPVIFQVLLNLLRTEFDANIFDELLKRNKFTHFLELIPNKLEVGEIFLNNFEKTLKCVQDSNESEIEQLWSKLEESYTELETRNSFDNRMFLLRIIIKLNLRLCSHIYFEDREFDYGCDDVELIVFELSRRNFKFDCLQEFCSKFDEITRNRKGLLDILLFENAVRYNNPNFLSKVINLKWEIYVTLLTEFQQFICYSRQRKKYFYAKTLEFSCNYAIEKVFFDVYETSQNEKLFPTRELVQMFKLPNLKQFVKYSTLDGCTKFAGIMAKIFRNDKDKLEAMLMGRYNPNFIDYGNRSILAIIRNNPEKLKCFRELLVYAVRENDKDEFPMKPTITNAEFFEKCAEVFNCLMLLEEFMIGDKSIFIFIESANLYLNTKNLRLLTYFALQSKFKEIAINWEILFSDLVRSNFNETVHDDDEIIEQLENCDENIRNTFFDVLVASFVIKLINNLEDDKSDTNQNVLKGNSDENLKSFLIFISSSDSCSNIRKILVHSFEAPSFTLFNKKKIPSEFLKNFPHDLNYNR
ncbi:uncharacterized protein LOC119075580 [Bradysia coprophila]|uniref:uncharacterized protein LOC119075580 n=1 Tax=Bradysia coprophila TaxID=38358 RepID=UPI00187DAC13|nr:uncharacterized protein LOC119075580 [Bradysia coprophila]